MGPQKGLNLFTTTTMKTLGKIGQRLGNLGGNNTRSAVHITGVPEKGQGRVVGKSTQMMPEASNTAKDRDVEIQGAEQIPNMVHSRKSTSGHLSCKL